MAQTSRQYVQRLQVIHGAQVMMIAIFSFIAYMSRPTLMEGNEMLIYVLTGVLIAGILGSRIIFKTLIAKAHRESTLHGKLLRYLTASIVRLAFLELPGLFAAVIVLVTGNLMAFIGSAGIFLMLFLVRPTAALITQELELGGAERSQMENPDAVVME